MQPSGGNECNRLKGPHPSLESKMTSLEMFMFSRFRGCVLIIIQIGIRDQQQVKGK